MKPTKIIILATLTMVNYQLSMVNCSAQNVGVNTTGATPDSKHLLEVLQPSTTDNSVGIYVKHSGADATKTLYGFQSIRDGAGLVNVGAYLQAINGTSNYALIVPPGGGNVGIGTTAPSGKLSLYSGVSEDLIRIASPTGGTNYSGIRFEGTVGGWALGAIRGLDMGTYNGSLIFYTDGDGVNNTNLIERMRIAETGNVGIGTTAPLFPLHVESSNTNGLVVKNTNGLAISLLSTNPTVGFNSYWNGTSHVVYRGNSASYAGRLEHRSSTGNMEFIVSSNAPASDGAAYTPVTAMAINSVGNIGINCLSPQYKLHVVGNVGVTGTVVASGTITASTAVTACSDIRYKKDIYLLNNSLKNVLRLRGVNYRFKTNVFPEKYFSEAKQIGFIAQEIELVYPEVVVTDTEGYKSVDYSRLTPVLVEAIKEQQQIIEQLKVDNQSKVEKQDFEDLKKSNEELKSEIDEIKAILNQNSKK